MPGAQDNQLKTRPASRPAVEATPSSASALQAATLVKYRLTSGEREPAMNQLAGLAADVLGMPYGLVTVVHGEDNRIIGASGVDLPGIHLTSLCAITRQGTATPAAVMDTRRDPRFCDDPLVAGPPSIRFIAGAPLMADGQRVGSLSVMDKQPREISAEALERLGKLAELGTALVAGRMAHGINQRHLAERTELLRTALESIDEGIAVFTAGGKLAACSDAFFELLKIPEGLRHAGTALVDIVTDLSHRGYLGEGEPDTVAQSVLRSLHAGKIRRNEIATSDGRTLSLSRIVKEDGRVIFTCLDVTERTEIEQMKDEFVSAVSHELRTPLTSITGSLGLLLGGAAGALPDKAMRLVKIAHSNSERLTKLVNELLDIDRLEVGRVELKREYVDLAQLSARVIEDCRPYAQRFDVNLELQAAPGAVCVQGDPDRLHQVVTNLLSNAVKHSPQGGTVTVAVTRGRINARLSVIDNGSGIPEAFRSRIFRRFAQLDPPGDRAKEGTGLGLAISRAIIDRHGGSIGFKSEEGKGSTFFFELPAATAGACASEAQDAGRTRILVCEDDLNFSKAIRHMLQRDGARVDAAGSIGEALELLGKHSYQALVVDLLLPDGNGLDLIREVRARHGIADLPVVVVTGSSLESRSEAGALNVIDWIDKASLDAPRLAAALAQSAAQSASRRIRVLHVEHEADLRELVAVSLRHVADVEAAETVSKARELLAANRYDAVILDITLPDGSGAQLISDIAAGGLTPVPVVIFSAADPLPETLAKVRGALIKSRTSLEQLAELVRHAAVSHAAGATGETPV